MKKEELQALGLTDDVIEKLMVIHGRDIEAHKTNLATVTQERDTLKGQLDTATAAINGFKGMTPEQVETSITEWKTKAAEAADKAAADIAALKFDHRLETVLKDKFKVKNVKAVRALLDLEKLKLDEDGETIKGLEDVVTPLQTSDAYLFDTASTETEHEEPKPRIVSGGGGQRGTSDKVVEAFRSGAKVSTNKGE